MARPKDDRCRPRWSGHKLLAWRASRRLLDRLRGLEIRLDEAPFQLGAAAAERYLERVDGVADLGRGERRGKADLEGAHHLAGALLYRDDLEQLHKARVGRQELPDR